MMFLLLDDDDDGGGGCHQLHRAVPHLPVRDHPRRRPHGARDAARADARGVPPVPLRRVVKTRADGRSAAREWEKR